MLNGFVLRGWVWFGPIGVWDAGLGLPRLAGIMEFFLEHISYGYRTAAEQVPDLWDDREQVPGLNSVGVVPTDPAEDSRELSWALLS